MLTEFEFGIADTEMSGFSQVPEFGALLCALPTWSPCMWVTRMMSILPRRGSVDPATVRPASKRMRVPLGSSKISARSCGHNSPSWLPSGVTFTSCANADCDAMAVMHPNSTVKLTDLFSMLPPRYRLTHKPYHSVAPPH